jgi:acetate kinase
VRVLVLNAGSSSLKAAVIDHPAIEPVAQAEVGLGADATRSPTMRRALAEVLGALQKAAPADSIEAVGHRVVHGGSRFRDAARLDPASIRAIDKLRAFAPLHNHLAVQLIRAVAAALPRVPQLAAFDTAFHADLPETAWRYPVPERWLRAWGIRRFGFHGLSVTWATERAAELLGRNPNRLCLVVAHLGSGCSVTAVREGRSAWTSMGMTPMEGLMMGTRAGSIDPGILLYLLRARRRTAGQLEEDLDHDSGLVAVSGRQAGMRELVEAAAGGDQRAALAVEMFAARAAAGIAAAATALPRLDALVFTGGIGENAAGVRSSILARLGALGMPPLPARAVREDALLSPPGTAIAVLRVQAREDVVVARQTVKALEGYSATKR